MSKTCAASLFCRLIVSLLPAGTCLVSANASEPSIDEVRALIGLLGNKDFKTRETAARRLATLEEAAPELSKALASSDPEISEQARRILLVLKESECRKEIKRMRADADSGRIDLLVERLTRWNGPLGDEDAWEEIMRAGTAIGKRGEKLKPQTSLPRATPVKPTPSRLLDFGASPGFRRSLGHEQIEHYRGLIRAASIHCTGFAKGVFVSRENFATKCLLSEAILFGNGNARLDMGLFNAILIVDGDVLIHGPIANSIVIARGEIKCNYTQVAHSIIISTTKFDVEKANSGLRDKGCLFKDKDAVPLDFVHWFSTSDIGIDVAADARFVIVNMVADGKLPAKSGLKKQDVISALDGAKVESIESFRKLLRKGSVQDRCVLTVNRGDKTLDIVLDFRAEERAKERAKASEKK